MKALDGLAPSDRTIGVLSHQPGERSVGKSSRYLKNSNGNKQRGNKKWYKELLEKKAVSLK